MVTYSHCLSTSPQEVFLKKLKDNTLASDQMWSENRLASWQLLCPTDSSPACGGIWYQDYLELRSWEKCSLLLLWKKKKALKMCVCVYVIFYVKYMKKP